jgi:hypothetical protein
MVLKAEHDAITSEAKNTHTKHLKLFIAQISLFVGFYIFCNFSTPEQYYDAKYFSDIEVCKIG